MSDHVARARERARLVLGGEGHRLAADDWRHAVLTARNALILLNLIWALARAFELPLAPSDGWRFLLAGGIGISVFLGIAAGLKTHTEVKLLDAELDRERREIEEHPDDEREEVRALYAAKGFREPLLSQIADVLCADDDRLLKVMMEEELGIFVEPHHHPILVGTANAAAGAAACLAIALPAGLMNAARMGLWIPLSAALLVTLLAWTTARSTGQQTVPVVARWLGLGAVSVGAVHFLGQWIAGR